ncbi:MAG: LytTR family transcriptional regulator [Alphaproteobacteria bacterium]|nr:LytTR family transcriptional regulator [Alphaproteobacteria bacterium]
MTGDFLQSSIRGLLARIRQHPVWPFGASLVILCALQWAYLTQIGMMNGQSLSTFQAGLIALCHWLPYLPAYYAVHAVFEWGPKNAPMRIGSGLILFAGLLSGLALWQTVSILTIVPSGHAFTTLFNAHLRTGLLQDAIGLATIFFLDHLKRRPGPRKAMPKIEIKDGARTRQISSADILFIEAEDYYIRVHTLEKSWLLRRPLYEMLARLEAFGCMRVSRSAIVFVKQIQALTRDETGRLVAEFANGRPVTVGKAYRKALKEAWSAQQVTTYE